MTSSSRRGGRWIWAPWGAPMRGLFKHYNQKGVLSGSFGRVAIGPTSNSSIFCSAEASCRRSAMMVEQILRTWGKNHTHREMNVSTHRMLRSFAHAVALAVLAMPGVAAADEVFAAKTQITLPNGQIISTFDISYVDPVLELYFLGDRTNKAVDQVDTRTNQVVAQLGQGTFVGFTGNNDTSGPNGVFTVHHRQIWAGDGNSTVHVIDLKSQQTAQIISTGGAFRADEGCVDHRDHLVLIANDAEHDNPANWPFVSFISTKTYQVLGKITMDGTNGTPLATN